MIDSEILKKYENNDHFFFRKEVGLAKVCNAPKKGSGVYVVYELKDGRISLVCIGACGKMNSDGNINYPEGGTMILSTDYSLVVREKNHGRKK